MTSWSANGAMRTESSACGVTVLEEDTSPAMKDSEQASASNGGQRPSLNSGFLSRRGWPKRSATK
jgi:hypothetical protein